jgi:hypothetical protein
VKNRGNVRKPLTAPADSGMNSAFMFLDETGRLPVARDRFFAVGLLKVPEPAVIQRHMQRLRDQKEFRAEMKWSEVRLNSLPLYRQALGFFFDCADAKFSCFVTDKTINDPIKRFGNQWRAYERLATSLLVGNISPGERVTVLADEYSTPVTETFEENLRRLVDKKLQRQAVCGVCRMRSTGVDLFQILDVLLGAVAYDFKVAAGLIDTQNPKGRLLNFIKDRFGVQTFVGGHQGPRLNVKEFGSNPTAFERAYQAALERK